MRAFVLVLVLVLVLGATLPPAAAPAGALLLRCRAGGAASVAAGGESLADLREAVEAALARGVDEGTARELAGRWRAVTAGAGSPGEVASCARVAASLCAAGPPEAVRELRADALRALLPAAVTSGRARRLLAGDFLPRLERLGPEEGLAEVRRYDALLAELARGVEEPAVRAALACAPLFLRVEVARTWDAPWLDAAERARVDADLAALGERFGALEGPTGASYAELAARDRAELASAAFGTVPDLTGLALDGEPVTRAELEGRVVLLVFWSSWCLPCLEAVPAERALADSLAGEPFLLLGVSSDEDVEAARRAAERTGMTWRSLHDGRASGEGRDPAAGRLARALGVRAWPSAFVLDGRGRLRAKFLATTFRPHWTTDEVAAAVRSLLPGSER